MAITLFDKMKLLVPKRVQLMSDVWKISEEKLKLQAEWLFVEALKRIPLLFDVDLIIKAFQCHKRLLNYGKPPWHKAIFDKTFKRKRSEGPGDDDTDLEKLKASGLRDFEVRSTPEQFQAPRRTPSQNRVRHLAVLERSTQRRSHQTLRA